MENKKVSKRILIGCPTYDGQAFCLDAFVKGLAALTYPDADILFVDNSETDEYAKRLGNLVIPGRKIRVIRDKPSETRISRIISSRNKVRDFFLAEGYDLLFFLDTDIIPPADVIDRLLMIFRDIASGIYLCRQRIGDKDMVLPTVYVAHDDSSVRTVSKDEIRESKVMDIVICGLGCCLIRRAVLEKIACRPFSESKTGGEDVAFCLDAKQEGFKAAAETAVRCSHVNREETLMFR